MPLKLLEAAQLCRFALESKPSDLNGGRLAAECVEEDIRFLYVETKMAKVFVIRGPETEKNWEDYGKLLADPAVFDRLAKATRGALSTFEDRYGPCSAATGHSLAGKLLEALPERIPGIAFNARSNQKKGNIESIRVHGDVAGQHTDQWIGIPLEWVPPAIRFTGVATGAHMLTTVLLILRLEDTVGGVWKMKSIRERLFAQAKGSKLNLAKIYSILSTLLIVWRFSRVGMGILARTLGK